VLEAAEALEQRDGRPPTNEAIARALEIPAETVRRLRHEALKRFSVAERPISQAEELRRLVHEQRQDSHQTQWGYDPRLSGDRPPNRSGSR
jgi:DNA-directed RNA polymerase specialized sigma subunit